VSDKCLVNSLAVVESMQGTIFRIRKIAKIIDTLYEKYQAIGWLFLNGASLHCVIFHPQSEISLKILMLKKNNTFEIRLFVCVFFCNQINQ